MGTVSQVRLQLQNIVDPFSASSSVGTRSLQKYQKNVNYSKIIQKIFRCNKSRTANRYLTKSMVVLFSNGWVLIVIMEASKNSWLAIKNHCRGSLARDTHTSALNPPVMNPSLQCLFCTNWLTDASSSCG